MEPLISLRDAVVLLGRVPALAGASLDVDPGEIVLLRGPNGAGKTTLLRLCAGLLPLSRGTAVVNGVDLGVDRRAVRTSVGLLGHANGLYGDLTVVDNVRFWGRAAGGTAVEVDGALDRLAVSRRLRDVQVKRLSAGQRRRVALATLVVRRPRTWLLDEPHAGLDADGRDLLDGLLREATTAGATVMFASHELDRAEAVATRTVTMTGGRIPESAPVQGLGEDGSDVG
jgi:heme ABC exporter ATP-binding subunit CcmA